MKEYLVSDKEDIKITIDLFALSVDFYTLIQITRGLESADIPIFYREKAIGLYLDSYFLLKDLSEKMARVMFDYLSLAAMGEARNFKRGEYKIPNLKGSSESRIGAQKHARNYNPYVFLNKLKTLFSLEGWASGYGGVKWRNICDAALMYKKVPNITFIDHIINITHNGGTAFDKGILLYLSCNSTFQRFLCCKRDYDDFINNYYGESSLYMSSQVFHLLKNVVSLGSVLPCYNYESLTKISIIQHNKLIFPQPVNWGNVLLKDVQNQRGDIINLNNKRIKEEEEEDCEEITKFTLLKRNVKILDTIKTLEKQIENSEKFSEEVTKSLPNLLESIYNKANNIFKDAKLPKDQSSIEMDYGFTYENFYEIAGNTPIRCANTSNCSESCKYKHIRPRNFYNTFVVSCPLNVLEDTPEIEIVEATYFCCSDKDSEYCNKQLPVCVFRNKTEFADFDQYSWPFKCFYNKSKVVTIVPWFEDKQKPVEKKPKPKVTLKEDTR